MSDLDQNPDDYFVSAKTNYSGSDRIRTHRIQIRTLNRFFELKINIRKAILTSLNQTPNPYYLQGQRNPKLKYWIGQQLLKPVHQCSGSSMF
jgi:hypothetical protein